MKRWVGIFVFAILILSSVNFVLAVEPAFKLDFDSVNEVSGTNFVGDAKIVNDPVRKNVLSLDGNGDYVQVVNPNFRPLTDHTVSFWLNVDNSGGSSGRHNVYYNLNGEGLYPRVYLGNDGWVVAQFRGSSSSPGVSTDNGVLKMNEWQFVVVTYNSASKEVSIYINGNLVKKDFVSASTSPLPSGSQAFLIGRDINLNYYFKGLIDDFRVYKSVLTASEIKGIYSPTPTFQDYQILSCTDTDGINYEVKGTTTVTYLYQGQKGANPSEDSCLNSQILTEGYCNNNQYAFVQYTCPNGCSNGVCNSVSPTPTPLPAGSILFDGDIHNYFIASSKNESYLMRASNFKIDGGVNKTTFYYRKNGIWVDAKRDARLGTVVDIGNVSFTVGTINKEFKEVVLIPSPGTVLELINVKPVCGDGVCTYLVEDIYGCPVDCIAPKVEMCKDSDGGLNIYVKGFVEDKTGKYEDICNGAGRIIERTCNFLNDPDGHVVGANVPCLSGEYCVDGACVQITPTTNVSASYCSGGICLLYEGGSAIDNLTGAKVSAEFVSSDLVKLYVGGESTNSLRVGQNTKLKNGIVVSVFQIDVQDYAGGIKKVLIGIALDKEICTPNYACSVEPAECPTSGVQKKVCKDTKCNSSDSVEIVNCDPGTCSGCGVNNRCVPYGFRLEENGKNMYCEISGDLLEQKQKLSDGSWASCQNNYECESNLCSGGECIEINDAIRETGRIRGVFFKILCGIANPISDEQRAQCIGNFLGYN